MDLNCFMFTTFFILDKHTFYVLIWFIHFAFSWIGWVFLSYSLHLYFSDVSCFFSPVCSYVWNHHVSCWWYIPEAENGTSDPRWHSFWWNEVCIKEGGSNARSPSGIAFCNLYPLNLHEVLIFSGDCLSLLQLPGRGLVMESNLVLLH